MSFFMNKGSGSDVQWYTKIGAIHKKIQYWKLPPPFLPHCDAAFLAKIVGQAKEPAVARVDDISIWL
jgi:hypothetical protein